MNVNGDSSNPDAKSYTDVVKDNVRTANCQPHFSKYMDSIENEYELLIKVLEGKGQFEVTDHLMLASGGKHPTTYADMYKDEQGNLEARETVLTDPIDLGSLQSLDYILELKKTHSLAQGRASGKLFYLRTRTRRV